MLIKRALSSPLIGRETDVYARAPTPALRAAGVRPWPPHMPRGTGGGGPRYDAPGHATPLSPRRAGGERVRVWPGGGAAARHRRAIGSAIALLERAQTAQGATVPRAPREDRRRI
jgi:hypothetical protein